MFTRMLTTPIIRFATVFLLLVAIEGCATGVAEFQYYNQAFEVQHVEASRVLDRLASAERTLAQRQIGKDRSMETFDPNQASNYLSVGDPPLTRAIRASLDSVRSYNGVLIGLATGETAAQLSSRIGTTTASISSAAVALNLVQTTIPALAAVERLLPIFTELKTVSDRAEMRHQILIAYPDIREFLVTLRDGTEEIYAVFRRSYVQRGSLSGVDGIPMSDLTQLEDDRQMLAAWVLLLDETLVAMDLAAKAAADGSSNVDLNALSAASMKVQALAETLRAVRAIQLGNER